MRTDLNELKTFLERELESRKKFNSSYSKNAFARDLDISATTLNGFLIGERDLSYKNLNAIFKYINSDIHCSFCAKPQKEVEYIIAGPRKLYICGYCIDECNKIKKENKKSPVGKLGFLKWCPDAGGYRTAVFNFYFSAKP
ncbi:MAG: hypothetical protein HN576_15095 [Bacteriovoracaceae bacterium]|nr:hypothetical protein [Bacteriovoracaceae bacterium]